MFLESTYALRILWGWIKCILYKNNLKYLLLPILYLSLIIILVPKTVIQNIVTPVKLDSYVTIVLTKEEKIKYILDKYNLTEYQFKVICGVVLSEAESNSYEDAYAVINTIYNRTITQSWVYEINKIRGENAGRSLYYQAIHPNQFVVYQEGFYLGMVGITDVPGYQAIIDFLYTEDAIHEYLSFRSCDSNLVVSYEQFSSNGNKYFNLIRDEDRISDEILVASNTRY